MKYVIIHMLNPEPILKEILRSFGLWPLFDYEEGQQIRGKVSL